MKEREKEIWVTLPNSRRYIVTFDVASGEVQRVETVFQRQGSRPQSRLTWDAQSTAPMTITAKCAARAAIAKMEADASAPVAR